MGVPSVSLPVAGPYKEMPSSDLEGYCDPTLANPISRRGASHHFKGTRLDP